MFTGIRRPFLLLPMLLGLAGCGNADMADLEAHVAEIRARPGGKIEPLPPMPEYPMPRYTASEGRNPFTPVGFAEPDPAERVASSGIRPDAQRPREPLEAFPLDSLSMVGTFQQGERVWGLVQAPDGVVHRVRPGNYLGSNHGRIVRIEPQRINLIEIVPNGMGGWLEQNASMAVKDIEG